MKTTLTTLLGIVCIPLLIHATPDTYFGQDLNTLPPVGPGSDNPTRLTNHPNADLAAGRFLSRLEGVATETFESFADRSTPASITFGPDTATLIGTPTVYNVPTNTYAGTFPISGDQFLMLLANTPSFFRIDFSTPQAAFGFYATDVEVAQLRISLVTSNGQRTDLTVPTLPEGQPSGSVLFFGVIDTQAPFITVEFARVGPSIDGFGFDNMTIGRLEQVHPEPASLGIGLYAGLDVTGTPGATYRIEYALSLPSTNWTALTNIVLPLSPYFFVDRDSVTNHGRRFYRAITIE
ncbi:MAG: hypothetical protein QHJ82_16385 [Verrucomicrobiota bacterium]|nr:hypothetical protein [Verrucomicrobiota bacterium]